MRMAVCGIAGRGIARVRQDGIMAQPYRVMFVCSGNICRSPMAEWVFRRCLKEAGLDGRVEVASSGIGPWHVGEPADPRAATTLRRHGYDCDHCAQQFERPWFDRYDLVVALDSGHRRALSRMAPDAASREKVRLLREFDPGAGDDLDVPDPYYDADDGFTEVLDMIEGACPGLLDHVSRKLAETV
jgi:protein-tyrosine phosphatase